MRVILNQYSEDDPVVVYDDERLVDNERGVHEEVVCIERGDEGVYLYYDEIQELLKALDLVAPDWVSNE